MAKVGRPKKEAAPAEVQRVPVFWRDHDDQSVRAWRGDWAGDQFEVISKVAFNTFQNIANRLGVATVEQAKED